MQFNKPEVLFALFFLLIPLLVHLFQLRKYQKEDFTNVKFLKKISRETRKSSRLKKWLVLIIRMLALGSIIIAFSQPYLSPKEDNRTIAERVIYVDNSFSMQANGQSGDLLNSAIQDLLKVLPGEENFHLITNNEAFNDLQATELKTRLQEIDFSSASLNFQGLEIKTGQYLKENKYSEIIILSDFQQIEIPGRTKKNISYHLVPYKPENTLNFFLDSLYIKEQDPEFLKIGVTLKSNQVNSDEVTVSAFNGEELLARKTLGFNGKNHLEGDFMLENNQIPQGRLELEDRALQYDNRLYFSINPHETITGLAITGSETESAFLNRIFTSPEFEFHNFTTANFDYNLLGLASFVILNEPEEISSTLSNALKKFHQDGGRIIIIPSQENTAVNTLLQNLKIAQLGSRKLQERLITNINFAHPLLKGVFEDEVENFEYPRVKSYFPQDRGHTILSFDDRTAFLSEINNVYLFSAPLNAKNSNFKNAPLVVPVFYNLGRTSLKLPQLHYQINEENTIEIPVEKSGDQVVSITSKNESFIPFQQALSRKVRLTTDNLPLNAGNYQIIYQGREVGNISYNYSREESKTPYREDMINAEVYTSVSEYFEKAQRATQNKPLWKWFVILALIFLTAEMLLLKYLQ